MPGLAGRLDSSVDSRGRLVLVSPRPQTYRMVYRNTTPPYSIFINPIGNDARNLLFDIQHVTPSFRNVVIKHVWVGFENLGAAAIYTIDFVRLAAPPFAVNRLAGVNPQPFSSDSSGASECQGFAYNLSNFTEDYKFSSTEFNVGATGAASTTNPPDSLSWIDILNNKSTYLLNSEGKSPTLPAAAPKILTTQGGNLFTGNDSWGVVVDVRTGAPSVSLRFQGIIEFTEE